MPPVVTSISSGTAPVVVATVGTFVISANTGNNTLTVADTASGSLVFSQTVNLSSTPNQLVVVANRYVYVTYYGTKTMSVLDSTNSFSIVNTITFADNTGFSLVHHSSNNSFYLSDNNNNIVAYNISSGAITYIAVGNATNWIVSSGNYIYAFLNSKAIAVINPATNTLVTNSISYNSNVQAISGAGSVPNSYAVVGSYAYIPVTSGDNKGRLLKVSLDPDAPSVTVLTLSVQPSYMVSSGTKLYIVESFTTTGNVDVIDTTTATPSISASISINAGGGSYAYITSHYLYVFQRSMENGVPSNIIQIDTATNAVLNTIPLLNANTMVYWITSSGSYVYITDYNNGLLVQIGGSMSDGGAGGGGGGAGGGGGGGGPVPCFPKGTRILTASGYKTVESLTQGELVQTADGRQVPVKLYGTYIPVTNTMTAPFKIPKGVFGVAHDLLLSPDHAFQVQKGLWMIPKYAAALSEKVEQVLVGSPMTYYHIECPQYLRDNLVVDGVVVESYAGRQLSTRRPYTYSKTLQAFTRSGAVASKSLSL